MGISMREYARKRGVSHTAVQKAIKSGRIAKEPDGTIDPEKADAAWETNTRGRADGPALAGKPGAPDYKTSRAIRETYAARLAKLEFEEKSGKLISADEVSVTVFNLARQARDRLMQIPRKLAPEIVATVTSDPDARTVETLLEDAIREALEELTQ